MTAVRPVHSTRVTWGLAAVAALITAVSIHPVNLWWLAWLAPAVVGLAAIRAGRTRTVFLAMYVTQLALFGWIHAWTGEVSVAGYPTFTLYSAAWVPIAAWIVRRVQRRSFFQGAPWAAILPVIWIGVEFFRGRVFFEGYPWYFTVHPLVEAPILVQSADLVGTYGASVPYIAIAGAVVDLFEARAGRRPWRSANWASLAACVLVVVNVAYGGWRMGQPTTTPGPSILAIQTNQLSQNKIDRDQDQEIADVRQFLMQTYEAFDRTGPVDLIVWPETTLPGQGLEPATIALQQEGNYYPGDLYLAALRRLREVTGSALLIGSPVSIGLTVVDKIWQAKTRYNSSYLIDGEPPFPRYDKIALTPFGERMPYISDFDWLEEKLLALGASGMHFNLSIGEHDDPLVLTRGSRTYRLATPICFEDTVPWLCRRLAWNGSERKVDLFINISNDGWLGEWNAIRRHHAQMARFRAIENRTPIVRVVNTGVTISIDSCGRVVDRLGEGVYGTPRIEGDLHCTPRLDSRTPLYALVGDAAGWLAMAGALIALIATFFGRPSSATTAAPSPRPRRP